MRLTVFALTISVCSILSIGASAQSVEPIRAATGDGAAREPSGPDTTDDGTGDGVTVVSPATGSSRQQVLQSAFDLYQTGEHGRAFQQIDRYAAGHPDDRTVAVRFARLLTEQHDFDGAITFLRDFLELHPQYQATSLELGSLLLAYLEHEEAAEVLSRIPASDSLTSRLARLNLGKALRALGQFPEARRVYQSIIGGPTDAFTVAALCEIDLAIGDIDHCRESLRQADDSTLRHGALLQTTAIMAYLEGDYVHALHQLATLETYGEPGTRALALHVLIPLAQGDTEAAEEGLNELRQETIKGERQILTALVRYASGNTYRAFPSYRNALERNWMFANPDLTQQVLIWRPELTASLRALAAETEAAGENDVRPQMDGPNDVPSEGCCSVVDSTPSPSVFVVIGLVAACICSRRRRHA